MQALLEQLHRTGQITDLDLHFARLMGRLAASAEPALLLASALVSNRTGQGHVCLPLRTLAGRELGGWRAPHLGDWLDALRATPVVGWPGEFTPLVLDRQGRLYLHRYWRYERDLAAALSSRAALAAAVDETALEDGIRRLFGPPPAEPDGQRLAAALALLRRLCIITGGPGTGKTTTVVRILALLLEQAGDDPLRIALAAPTGKAAGRLMEAIRAAKARLPVAESVRAAIPEQAMTLHRLLGMRADGNGFRHHRDNPLPVDVLVVDEASMVDLALMARLVDALPETARLILLGDRDQLASVEAGAVLAGICGDSGSGIAGYGPELARRLERITGQPAACAAGLPAVADCLAALTRSHRFQADSGIGALARAVNAGDSGAALALLRAGRYADLAWLEPAGDWRAALAERLVDGYRPYLTALRDGAEPATLFDAFNAFRVLCAQREGPFGTLTLNERARAWLAQAGLVSAHGEWYPGRPVMVMRNDYGLQLFNGDVGLTVAGADGLRVLFLDADGRPRWLPPSRLPPVEPVFAMTVHKSQGSEFDAVLLLLGDTPIPLHSRELVYTGLTRARARVELWAAARVLEQAAARRVERASALAERLWQTERPVSG